MGGGYPIDFNPVLLQGVRGYPGIRARLNQRAFQYASGMIADVLNQEIKKARIPPITQCIPQVRNCRHLKNILLLLIFIFSFSSPTYVFRIHFKAKISE